MPAFEPGDAGAVDCKRDRWQDPGMRIGIADLRRMAIDRSLIPPTTLGRALRKLGFVQADPIRAPARTQDLTLRHRVRGYRAGDLERRYQALEVEEDFVINYGFVTRSVAALMHPRRKLSAWPAARRKEARSLLEFIRGRGAVHPREVDQHFARGSVKNYWGGSSSATTHLLDAMHYRGMLRVVRRERGIRIYAAKMHTPAASDAAARRATIDALVDLVVSTYAPLPGASLSRLVGRLRHAVPQWAGELKLGLKRATRRLSHARVDGVDWYWPSAECPGGDAPEDAVRLLSPFDPVVWDRQRFELFWGWPYRFEAYTPAAKRRLGYYALPMLWRDRVIGWGNLSVKEGELRAALGYVDSRPRARTFSRELEAELHRMRAFLGL
jgi:uncharacterized protein YcaQ